MFPVVLILMWLPILLLLTTGFILIHKFPNTILKIIGWKWDKNINLNKLPQKSIMIMAPHTSCWDAVIGKIGLIASGIQHNILSSSHLFIWPIKPFMIYGLNAIPIGKNPNKNSIIEVAEFLKKHNSHILICPEGRLRATDKWNPGFYYMANKAQAPIIMTSMDYKTKTLKLNENPLDQTQNIKLIYQKIYNYYQNANPKYPNKFKLPKL